jgi:hypothetical protein
VKSLESAELLLKKTWLTRSSSWPLRSSGSKVFSKIGKSRLRTIACTSESCSAIPASKAASKCSSRMSANGGSP